MSIGSFSISNPLNNLESNLLNNLSSQSYWKIVQGELVWDGPPSCSKKEIIDWLIYIQQAIIGYSLLARKDEPEKYWFLNGHYIRGKVEILINEGKFILEFDGPGNHLYLDGKKIYP